MSSLVVNLARARSGSINGVTSMPTLIAIGVAVIFALLVVNIDWELLRGYYFIDRRNYFEYFKYEENVLSFSDKLKWYQYISIEYLWHAGMPFALEHVTQDIFVIFDALSFFCLFTFSYYVLKKGPWWALFLLINPLLMTLAFDQMRMALAFSLLLWAYVLPRSWGLISVLLCVLAPLFHTSSVLFILLYAGLVLLRFLRGIGWFGPTLTLVILVLVGAFMSFVFGDFLQSILAAVGDRRADRYLGDASSGIKYTSFWLIFLLVVLLQKHEFLDDIGNQYCVIILSFVVFNLVFGGYSTRFLAVSLPFMVIAMRSIEQPLLRYGTLSVYLAYACLQWSFWIR